MLAKLPDTNPRRIAVVLDISSSGQPLLDVLQRLLGQDGEINLKGVFVEDDGMAAGGRTAVCQGTLPAYPERARIPTAPSSNAPLH